MRVIDLENINSAMQNETQFVLRCEEVFHDKISAAAASILSTRQERPVVALTGPSGSGKTTTSLRLEDYLKNLGVKVCVLHMDNFFLPLDRRPPEATDWESPYCVDVDSLIGCISQLMDGKEVDIPWYDFKTGNTGGYTKMQGYTDAVIIAEGIHMLNPLIFDKLRGVANGIYVAPRTRIITNDDKIVRPEQLRVARRMIRDYNTRGHSIADTVERAESVDRGEINYIQPYKGNAAIHIDTFHDYEPCILAKYLNENVISTDTFKYQSVDLLQQASDLQSLSEATNKQLIWIAAISLVVGGIGVMNIMLVSVTERTREIGLKIAIGAQQSRILWQFLTEAAVLTSMGGILGVATGIGLAEMLSHIMGTPVAISVPACVIAVAFSMVIGVVFGLVPAMKASKLNPIEALRRE